MPSNNRKLHPNYLPKSFELIVEWAHNFKTHVGGLAAKYGVPGALITAIDSNDLAMQTIFKMENVAFKFYDEIRVVRRNLMDPAMAGEPPENWPTMDALPDLGPLGAPYLLAPFIQAATIIRANPLLSENDKNLLRLGPAAKPVTNRKKAENFNYPWIKAKYANGQVKLTITRGDRWAGKIALIQVDRSGTGQFQTIIQTILPTFSEPVALPVGVSAAAWCYRAIYVENHQEISDWSPVLPVSIVPIPSAFTASGQIQASVAPNTGAPATGPGAAPEPGAAADGQEQA